MPILPGASNRIENQAGASASGLNYLAVLACCAAGDDFQPRVYTNVDALLSVHGYCEGAEYVALHTEETGKPVLFVGLPIADPGVVGREDTSGNTGASVTTLTEGPDGVLAETDGVLVVDENGGGTVGTDQIKLKLSLDGGRTFKKVRLGTANSYVLRDNGGNEMGLTIGFGAGDLVAGDTIHTWHSTGPRWDQAGLLAARTALGATQKRARSWLVVGDLLVEDDATDLVDQLVLFESANERYTRARANLRDRLPLAAMSQTVARMTGAPNVTFAEVGAGNDTATRSAGSFTTDGFANGDTVRVTGAVAGAGHNNIVGVANVTSPTVLTFPAAGADFDNEGPIAGVSMTAEMTLTFGDNGGSPDTLTRNRGSWLADGFRVGDSVTIDGSASNDGTYVITALTATVLSVVTASFAAEVIGSSEVTVVAGETKAAWIADLDAEFEDVRGEDEFRLELAAGRGFKTSPLTGFEQRRPAAWAISLREFQHDLHIATWQKDQGSLNGWDLEDADGVLVEFDERADGGALAAGFSCLRTWGNGPPGVFVAMAITRAEEGAVLQFSHNADVANHACSVEQSASENAIGRSLVLNDDGTPTAASLSKIKAEVLTSLERELLENKLGEGPRASAVDWTPATDDDLRLSPSNPTPTMNAVLELNLNGTIVRMATKTRVT